MEVMGIEPAFWKHKRVLITGHTGFKGTWLTFWLTQLGAKVKGYSLPPPTRPNLYQILKPEIAAVTADIRDGARLQKEMRAFRPEIVMHLAAQPIVRASFLDPYKTYSTNVLGTVNVLEAARRITSVRVLLLITSDKCYGDSPRGRAFRETDALGGEDPYSCSKACAELTAVGYRRSLEILGRRHIGIATVRAGNVIGGGDWAEDRLVPDCIRAFQRRKIVNLRHSGAVRPWQHVLEPLHGYLLLARRLYQNPVRDAGAWNFGPQASSFRPVGWIVRELAQAWGDGAVWKLDRTSHPPESRFLRLDSSKARCRLRWQPRWKIQTALEKTAQWYRAFYEKENMKDFTMHQIKAFERAA